MAGVTYTRDGKIASIKIDAGNASNADLRKQLNSALMQYKNDEEAWMAVVSATGKDFALGTQKEAPPKTTHEKRELASLWGGGYVEVWKPTIAAVQGRVTGEGLAVALGCDLVVAEEDAVFTVEQSPIDEPDVVPVWLVALVGLSKALEMLWLRTPMNAKDAVHFAFVNRLAVQGPLKEKAPEEGRLPMAPFELTITVPDGKAVTAATLLADELLTMAPITRNFQKEIAHRSVGVPFHYAQTLEIGRNPYISADSVEGARAFAENRRPVWKNR